MFVAARRSGRHALNQVECGQERRRPDPAAGPVRLLPRRPAGHPARPDVVISDIGLPGEIDGYGVAQALRGEVELQGAYLIALSGYANEQARRRSSAGARRTLLIFIVLCCGV